MTFALPKKTRILWQARVSLAMAALYALVVAFCHDFPFLLLPTTIAMAIGSVFVLVYISFYFRCYTVKIDKNAVYIKKGMIFRTVLIIPFPRCAVIKSFSTPVTSMLKLRCVLFKVARGWVFVPEIDDFCAEELLKAVRDE